MIVIRIVKIVLLLFSVFNFSATAARAEAISNMDIPAYLNLRARRTPQQPWTVTADPFTATVKSTVLSETAEKSSWLLNVELSAARAAYEFLSVSTKTHEAHIVSVENRLQNSKILITLKVTAPFICEKATAREPVTLQIGYRTGLVTSSIDLDVDHRCLLGDTVPRGGAEHYAALVKKYLNDPAIEQLIAFAQKHTPSAVDEELKILMRLIAFTDNSLQSDPIISGKFWRNQTAYALSPTETLRLGGDCEDWTILTAAYFVRRNFRVIVTLTIGHVWIQVIEPITGSAVTVDLTNVLSHNNILSTAAIN